MTQSTASLADMTDRSREVFRRLVETYLDTGEPVGSRTLSKSLEENVSAATIRNVMQDLEGLGLLGSPHVSAGRLPTQLGLRLFVDGLLEIGDLPEEERARIDGSLAEPQQDVSDALAQAGAMLSGLTQSASLVTAPKREVAIKHLEFVALGDGQALAVLVLQDGTVENRLLTPPAGLTPSAMREAANFLNTMLQGKTLSEAQADVRRELAARRRELDALAAQLVERGIAVWSGDGAKDASPDRLIVRGRANLIDDAAGAEQFELMRQLFDDLERKEDLLQLLDSAEDGAGVRVFIGSENKLFSLSGSSLVISPYMDEDRRIIGAIGVIGPTRLNYGRVVPIVEYTANLVGRIVTDRTRL